MDGVVVETGTVSSVYYNVDAGAFVYGYRTFVDDGTGNYVMTSGRWHFVKGNGSQFIYDGNMEVTASSAGITDAHIGSHVTVKLFADNSWNLSSLDKWTVEFSGSISERLERGGAEPAPPLSRTRCHSSATIRASTLTIRRTLSVCRGAESTQAIISLASIDGRASKLRRTPARTPSTAARSSGISGTAPDGSGWRTIVATSPTEIPARSRSSPGRWRRCPPPGNGASAA